VETTALGAAQLAGLAVGALPDLAACRAMTAPAVRLLPRISPAERAAARERWQQRLEAARGGAG
jgi:glycerol kinase